MMGNSRLAAAMLCAGLMVVCMAGCGADNVVDSAGAGAGTVESVTADNVDESAGPDDGFTAGNGDGREENPAMVDEKNGADMSADTEQLYDEMEEEISLKGLSLSVLGDSISTFDGWIPEGFAVFYPSDGDVTDVSQTWWMRLIDDTDMELCSNSSSSGSTCVGNSLTVDDPLCGCSGYRISYLAGKQGKMPDIIIVYIGTNDLLTDVPIGDNDGTKMVEEGVIRNFSDAYCMMLDKLTSEYPIAQIYCCTLPPIGDWGTKQPFVTFENSLGLTSEDYSKQIQIIAENKGVSVIDLYRCGIEIDNLDVMTIDGVHFTLEGMKHVEQAVLNGIKKTANR